MTTGLLLDSTVGSTLAQPALRRLIQAMPKAELHLHLDGSIRVETALELARTRELDAPRDYAGMFAALVAPPHCADQAELLRAFDLPIALMQDAEALRRIARELVEAKAADNVRYVEIRWAPALHVLRGLSIDEVIEAVCQGAAEGAAGADSRTAGGAPRRGAAQTTVRLICTAMRSHEPESNVRLAETAARFRDAGLTGFDLAGPEAAYPDAAAHRRAFDAARAGALHITLHAGELGGAAQVRAALAVLPERIAHGPGAIDDPELCRELAERGITLDLCPTSNAQASIVPSVEAHPLARLHRLGVPVTLSTDDTTVSDLTLSEEYERAVVSIGLSLPELWAIDRHALAVAFAEREALVAIEAEFDAWEALVG